MARRKSRKKFNQEQQLIEAYRALNKMCPSLTQYARTYSGKRTVRVIPGPITQTDGNTIEIRPPLDLAYQIEHWRQVCGVRMTSGKLMCEACSLREQIMTRLHHEIAHIAHGSFSKYSRYDVQSELADLVQRLFPQYRDTLYDVMYNQMDYESKKHSLEIAGMMHEHIAMVHLTCEDHRINTASYVREPGLWKRMHDLSEDILYNGVEQDDGTRKMWQDSEPDQQILIAPLFYMEGFDIRGQFDEDVVNCVLSDEATQILDKIADSQTSMDNLADSIRLLWIYRDHGFLQKHSEARDPNKDNEERDAFMELLRQLLKAVFGHGEKLGGKGEASDDTGSGPGNDDELDDGSVVKIITAMKYIEDVPGHLDGVNVYKPGEGPCASGYYTNEVDKASESIIGKAVAKSRIAFGVNARAKTHRDQKSGKVDARNLGKRAWNDGDSRLFKHKTVPDKRDYEVLIGFDISGSTSSGYGDVSRLEMLKFSVCALADTMHRLGVKFSIYAHNTGYGVSSDDDTCGASMDIYQIKTADENWTPDVRKRVANMRSGGSNLDGNTLRYYRKQLDRSRATDKILMYFTDGVMPGMAYREELPVLQEEIEVCRRKRYTLLGVGVFTDAPADHGLPTVQVDSEADYPTVIDHLAKRLQG